MFSTYSVKVVVALAACLFLVPVASWGQTSASTQQRRNTRINAAKPEHHTPTDMARRDEPNNLSRNPTPAPQQSPSSSGANAVGASRADQPDWSAATNRNGRNSIPATSASYGRTPTVNSLQDQATEKTEGPSFTNSPVEEEEREADESEEPTPWRLFSGPLLGRHGIEANGWWANGYTWNPSRPTNRLNGPNGVNDRANDYMFHQLGLGLERAIDPSSASYQWGGRIDLMYGADARLVQSAGFDDTWHSGRFVSLATPQVYAEWFDPNLNPWGQGVTFRVGRFWSPIGYEGVPSLDRFFFSATHAFMLAQPSTHTGFMASADIGSNWSAQGGLVRGWDVTTDNNKSPGYIGTLGWLSDDEATSLTHVLYHGDETDDLSDAQTTYELILTRQLTESWSYVGWFDFNFAQRIGTNSSGDPSNAQWLSLNQALLHAINDQTSWGIRGEWFHDNDGARIANPETGDLLGQGNLFGLTLGINHTPTMNLLIRPEIRYDWSTGGLPFDDQTSSRQVTAGFDVVWSF
ncbi:MAG: outer membrane beta-barrel protein [Planctomycetaceae bacterium]|nr:outer membrane beta-barrel protein [Planctomycetaceae bacterium]